MLTLILISFSKVSLLPDPGSQEVRYVFVWVKASVKTILQMNE